MLKTNINPAIYQEFLDSAANAAQIGQAQFFTPVAVAKLLGIPFTLKRPILCDLTAGNGQLLAGLAKPSTQPLACEIDPDALAKWQSRPGSDPHQSGRAVSALNQDSVNADITLFAQLLDDVGWRADLLALNPPWSLQWHTDRFPYLNLNPNQGAVIDSTLATYLLAIHFLTETGEAIFICNTATYERLIAPLPEHRHIWGTITLEGNPCTNRPDSKFVKAAPSNSPSGSDSGSDAASASPARTTILYLKKSWTRGPLSKKLCTLTDLEAAAGSMANDRAALGLNASLRYDFQFNNDTLNLWHAAAEEWSIRQQKTKPRYNLWLVKDTQDQDIIQTYISLYDEKARHNLRKEATILHKLQGKSPIKLVTQRAERDLLLQTVGIESGRAVPALNPTPQSGRAVPALNPPSSPWNVDPKLQEAVRKAVDDYHRNRAPIIPLPEIQRLGYLDEEDSILCKQDLTFESESGRAVSALNPPSKSGRAVPALNRVLFRAGHTYPLTTQSVEIKRRDTRYNPLNNNDEEIEFTGYELATYITGEDNAPYCFIEARIKEGQNKTGKDQVLIAPKQGEDGKPESTITAHFTLQDLVKHFHIPEVPDITTLYPDQYQANLNTLAELESILS